MMLGLISHIFRQVSCLSLCIINSIGESWNVPATFWIFQMHNPLGVFPAEEEVEEEAVEEGDIIILTYREMQIENFQWFLLSVEREKWVIARLDKSSTSTNLLKCFLFSVKAFFATVCEKLISLAFTVENWLFSQALNTGKGVQAEACYLIQYVFMLIGILSFGWTQLSSIYNISFGEENERVNHFSRTIFPLELQVDTSTVSAKWTYEVMWTPVVRITYFLFAEWETFSDRVICDFLFISLNLFCV